MFYVCTYFHMYVHLFAHAAGCHGYNKSMKEPRPPVVLSSDFRVYFLMSHVTNKNHLKDVVTEWILDYKSNEC